MSDAVLDRARLETLLATARVEGRTRLHEHEGLELIAALGIGVPHHLVLAPNEAVPELGGFAADRVVVKLISPEVAHKTELGGVAVVPRDPRAVAEAMAAMAARAGELPVAGYIVADFVPHDTEPGGELLLGLRHSTEFGPVVTLGLGGVTAERLSAAMSQGEGPAIFSPRLDCDVGAVLAGRALGPLATGGLRGRSPRADLGDISSVVRILMRLAAWTVPDLLAELEINPLVFVEGRPIALDALVRLGTASEQPAPPRPLHRAAAMLRPRSIAVMGASARGENPGRIILQNTLAAGFPPEAMVVVKPGIDTLDGVACVPDLASLPGPVDLLVVAVPAEDVPGVLVDVVDGRCAGGIVLIPGGLGEREGTGARAEDLRRTLRASRNSDWGGPAINGGNCLGLRSADGRVDTLFIPHDKLPLPPEGARTPLALLSQSGAFAIARLSRRPHLAPRAVITAGNQLDLTVGDWLDVLAEDPGVRAVGCYVEGFAPLDGARFARRVASMADEGRPVVVYRAGRTAEGASATASHTASMAGDPVAARALLEQAGALVAETIDDFEDLAALCGLLADRRVDGVGLGVMSNAGFECVAVADNLGPLALAALGAATRQRLEGLLADAQLAGIVDVNHPLDVTPVAPDPTFADCAAALLADDAVHIGMIGCVPLTGRLATLAGQLGEAHGVTERLLDLWRHTDKAWVTVIDSGPLYDAMATMLEAAGMPVFRSADRATRLLGRYAKWRSDRSAGGCAAQPVG